MDWWSSLAPCPSSPNFLIRQIALKVAAVELLKSMQEDEDEGTAESVRAKVESYPEVCFVKAVLAFLHDPLKCAVAVARIQRCPARFVCGARRRTTASWWR